MTMPSRPVTIVFAILVMLLAATATATSADAQLFYSESVDGDLGMPSAPTSIGVLLLGTNTVSGRLENESGFDRDAFSFEVPDGLEVSTLSMSSLTGSSRFLAVSEGAISEFDASGNLFTTLIGQSDVGINVLDGNLNRFGGSGVAGNLGAGSYSVWFQETDGSNVDYSFAITTISAASIPEPGSLAIVCSGMMLVGLRRNRKISFSA